MIPLSSWEFLCENTPYGIAFADREGNVFYANDLAMEWVVEESDESDWTIPPDHPLQERLSSQQDDFELSFVGKQGLFINARARSVFHQDEFQGFLLFFEDQTRQQNEWETLKDERDKFEKLASRLNDMIMREAGSQVFKHDYIQRKLDLEIRHAAHQVRTDCQGVLSITFDSEIWQKHQGQKNDLTAEDRLLVFLKEQFPDPHLLGRLEEEGAWLIVLSRSGARLSDDSQYWQSQLQSWMQIINADLAKSCCVEKHDDLGRFADANELISLITKANG
ncbi:MAG: hypothetical protein H7A33_01255 [Deltaproteobacteria bacterium]|nr:hypothetical protein [Deltaproteobacteria bacterium]